MIVQNGRTIVKSVLQTIVNDGGSIVATQPNFNTNPLGHILWNLLKGGNMNDIDRKFTIVHRYKNRENCAYGRGRNKILEEQVRNLNVGMMERSFRKFAELCNKK